LLQGCATQPLPETASLSADISQRAGVSPAWTQSNAKSIDAQSLRDGWTLALPSPLDEVRAVAIALDASPAIALMISQTNALRAEAIDVSSPQNPMVNFSSAVPLDSMNAVPIFAMLLVQIDELWKQPLRSEAARELYQSALTSLGASAVSLAADTRAAWHDTSLRESECVLAQHDLEITKHLLAISRERFAVGESTGDTVAKAQAEMVDAHHRAVRAQEMLSTAQLALMSLLGRAQATTEWRTGVADTASVFVMDTSLADEQALLDRLADTRLDVRAAQARANSGRAKRELALRSRSNKLQVGAGYESDMQGMQGVAFSANMEIPIFNDGSARIAMAEAEYQSACIDAERVRQQAIIELRGAIAKATASQQKHDASAEGVFTPSVETFARAQASLAAGEGSQREAIDAEHALNHAKLELNDLERERRSARLSLAKASGFLPAEVLP